MKIAIPIIIFLLTVGCVAAGKIVYKGSLSCETNSMYPTIKCGDIFDIVTVNRYDLVTIGNIYCYRPDHRYFRTHYYNICHRLDYVQDGLYYFSGDNNKYFDPPVERKYIGWEIRV